MNKRNMVLSGLAILTVAGFTFRTPIADFATKQILEWRLESAIYEMNHTSFDQIVSRDVVTEAVNDNNRGPYSARKAILNRYLCPVFGDKHDEQGRCFDVLYGTNTGQVNYWYAKAGVPVSAAPKVSEFRAVAMRRAKEYLAKPDNLSALYRTRKDMIVTQFHRMTEIDRQAFINQLESANLAFAYIVVSQVRTDEFNQEYIMFAKRRRSEGGKMLLATYVNITADLLDTLRQK